MVSFNPAIPHPYSTNWREAYRYSEKDSPRLSSYQPHDGDAVPFVLEKISLSGGQAVDTQKFPFFGRWSNVALNEEPQEMSLTGYIRGETYIKNRNLMGEALRRESSDEEPGYLLLPLWGRFPVVVIRWNIDEDAQKNGQCLVNLTFKRAGLAAESRSKEVEEEYYTQDINTSASALQDASIAVFTETLSERNDPGMIASAFTSLKTRLISIVGRIQGYQSALNKMTNSVVSITTLIAQGVRSPAELALALFGAVSSIIAGVAEIKDSTEDTVEFFTVKDNVKNVLMLFLSDRSFVINDEAATVNASATRDAVEGLYKTAVYFASAQLLTRLDNLTRETAGELFALLLLLEASLSLTDPDVYAAAETLRIAVSKEMSGRNLPKAAEINIASPMPLLALSQYLGSDEETLRVLNNVADSFYIKGNVIYV